MVSLCEKTVLLLGSARGFSDNHGHESMDQKIFKARACAKNFYKFNIKYLEKVLDGKKGFSKQNYDKALEMLIEAGKKRKRAKILFDNADYSGVVETSQHSIELAIKSLFVLMGLDYSFTHDPGKELDKVVQQLKEIIPIDNSFESAITMIFRRLEYSSEVLSRFHTEGMYGFKGVPASQLFNVNDAEYALSQTGSVLVTCWFIIMIIGGIANLLSEKERSGFLELLLFLENYWSETQVLDKSLPSYRYDLDQGIEVSARDKYGKLWSRFGKWLLRKIYNRLDVNIFKFRLGFSVFGAFIIIIPFLILFGIKDGKLYPLAVNYPLSVNIFLIFLITIGFMIIDWVRYIPNTKCPKCYSYFSLYTAKKWVYDKRHIDDRKEEWITRDLKRCDECGYEVLGKKQYQEQSIE